jgi:hypothetical protein
LPIYQSLNLPPLEFDNFWTSYLTVLNAAEQAEENALLKELLAAYKNMPEGGEDQGIPILPGMVPVVLGENGVPAGISLASGEDSDADRTDDHIYGYFSDEEEVDELW